MNELALSDRLALEGTDDTPLRRLGIALFIAGAFHLLVILAVSFERPASRRDLSPALAMEVLVLPEGPSTPHPPADAVLSQHDREGDSPQGNALLSRPDDHLEPEPVSEEEAATTPAPPVEVATAPAGAQSFPPIPATTTSAQPELEVAMPPLLPVLTAESSDVPEALPVSSSTPTVDAAQILVSQGQEIARLTASLEARTASYERRVRRRAISASTREYRYANYLGAWARKVERIGNLNYPQAAKEQRLYGSLILHVAVRADGSVENIRVVRSSGYALLDEAAVRIVELAAPYAPFPPDIAAETDVLDIVRTWQFLRGGVLGWERSDGGS